MMDHLSVFVIFSIIFGAALGAFLSDGVKKMHFKKLLDGSDEYEFEYDLDNGDVFRGQTYAVFDTTYFMFGSEGEIYWTTIDRDEFKDEKITKIVRKAERNGNRVDFVDDFIRYSMSIDGSFSVIPYTTKWDLENICFTKADNQTFNFTISSTNNSRKYNGITYRETDDPKVQRMEVLPSQSFGGVFEIYFTDIELLSNEVFCRGYDKQIEFKVSPLGIGQGMWINPKLTATLVG